MLCSTIIPTVNRPSLELAVGSALSQGLGLELYEIIVVNDSGNLLPESDWLKSPQVSVMNTNQCERSVARNVGAAVASGKYVHFLDDDDFLLPGGLKALLDAAESSNCSWIYGAHNRVDDDGIILSVNRPDIKGNILALLVAGESIHHGPSLINREAFFQVGCFDPALRTMEDRDLQGRIGLIGDFCQTNYLVASVRIGVGGVSTTDWSRAQHESRVIREKILDTPGALARIKDSVQGNAHRRGYCFRAYLSSAALNVLEGRLFTAASRFFMSLRLAGIYTLLPDFWRGLFYFSEWHTSDKRQVDEHYANKPLPENVEAANTTVDRRVQ